MAESTGSAPAEYADGEREAYAAPRQDPLILELFRLAVECARDRHERQTSMVVRDWRTSTLVLNYEARTSKLRFLREGDLVLLHFDDEPFLSGKVDARGEISEVRVLNLPVIFGYPSMAETTLNSLQAAIKLVRDHTQGQINASGHA